MERTLVLIKPDAVSRALIGRIVVRFEDKGFRLCGLKMMRLTDSLLSEHYAHLADAPFYGELVAFMTSTPVIALCIEGRDAVRVVRDLAGPTDGAAASPDTIRGQWSQSIQANIVHASDSTEAAAVEVPRFFDAVELFEYHRAVDQPVGLLK